MTHSPKETSKMMDEVFEALKFADSAIYSEYWTGKRMALDGYEIIPKALAHREAIMSALDEQVMGAVVPDGVLSREEDTQKTCPAPASMGDSATVQSVRKTAVPRYRHSPANHKENKLEPKLEDVEFARIDKYWSQTTWEEKLQWFNTIARRPKPPLQYWKEILEVANHFYYISLK